MPALKNMIPNSFHATNCTVIQEDGILITTLSASSLEDQDFYLMLQHKLDYDDQDIQLGMNMPYIEFCGQGWSWYGHILSFRLFRDRIEVQMDGCAASEMQNNGFLEIGFTLGDQDFNSLRASLNVTFNGQAYFSDES